MWPDFDFIVVSVDSAFAEKEENDPTGCTPWTPCALGGRRPWFRCEAHSNGGTVAVGLLSSIPLAVLSPAATSRCWLQLRRAVSRQAARNALAKLSFGCERPLASRSGKQRRRCKAGLFSNFRRAPPFRCPTSAPPPTPSICSSLSFRQGQWCSQALHHT
jgi:hypothetical protein